MSTQRICTQKFTAALFITAKAESDPNVYQHEWLNKMWYIHRNSKQAETQRMNRQEKGRGAQSWRQWSTEGAP